MPKACGSAYQYRENTGVAHSYTGETENGEHGPVV